MININKHRLGDIAYYIVKVRQIVGYVHNVGDISMALSNAVNPSIAPFAKVTEKYAQDVAAMSFLTARLDEREPDGGKKCILSENLITNLHFLLCPSTKAGCSGMYTDTVDHNKVAAWLVVYDQLKYDRGRGKSFETKQVLDDALTSFNYIKPFGLDTPYVSLYLWWYICKISSVDPLLLPFSNSSDFTEYICNGPEERIKAEMKDLLDTAQKLVDDPLYDWSNHPIQRLEQ